MRALVTGAAGFVGSRVARALAGAENDVHAVVRRDPGPRLERVDGIRLERCDLADPIAVAGLIARVEPELCIHCAWIATPGAYLTSPENATHEQIAGNLALRLVEQGCGRIVGVGTCFEYAMRDGPLGETSPLGPTTPYARAKLAALECMQDACEDSPTTLAWARLFYLYGPGEDPRRLVPSVVLSLLAGEPARTTPGEQLRDFLHVDDVAEALAAVARSDVTGSVNVGAGHSVAVRELVETLGEITGRPDLVELGALPYAPGDPMVVSAETSRLNHECGFTQRRTLADGLSETVRWWSAHRDTR
jgi:nucleoside-diphosphate-sugar epimerase